MGIVKGEITIMTTSLTTVLASAHDVLARGETRIKPRVLARFAKKIRLAEGALEAAQAGGTTEPGLRAVVARAEAAAAKRSPTADQARALDDLRARLGRLDASASGATDVSKLTESLRADTKALEAELTKPEKPKKSAQKKPAKRAKKKP
jgi:hypothetical protein